MRLSCFTSTIGQADIIELNETRDNTSNFAAQKVNGVTKHGLLYLFQLYSFTLDGYSNYLKKKLRFVFITLLNSTGSTEQSFREADSH